MTPWMNVTDGPSSEDSQTEEQHTLCNSIYRKLQSRQTPLVTSEERTAGAPTDVRTLRSQQHCSQWPEHASSSSAHRQMTGKQDVVCTHVEYDSALKRDEALTHATTWTDLEDVMLVKLAHHTHKNSVGVHSYEVSRAVNFTETERTMVAARGSGREEGS